MNRREKAAPRWTVARTVGPLVRAVSPEDMKAALFIPPSEEQHDIVLAERIDAATEIFEHDTARICIDSTFVYFTDRFPSYLDPFRLPIVHAHTVEKLTYLDDEGTEVEYDVTQLEIIPGETYVRLKYGAQWPSEVTPYQRSVRLQFVAGNGTDQSGVPESYKQAIRLNAGAIWNDPVMDSKRDVWRNAYQQHIQSLLPTWPLGSDADGSAPGVWEGY